jgi:hypothetical protein
LTCSCGKKASYRYLSDKQLVTTVGVMQVPRRYYACRHCGTTHRPWDAWAGVGRRQMTEHARKMMTLVGSAFSFESAAKRLEDLCSIRTSNDTVRRVCDEEGQRARQWIEQSDEPVRHLARASGHHEFYTDGVKVNTTGGWRELRLSVLARREAGAPTEPQDWEDRPLPPPTARLAWGAIADSQQTGAGWQRLSERVGLSQAQQVHVLADGAKWIWDQARDRLPKHNTHWCVDVYHVSEHLHACGKALFESTDAAKTWAEQALHTALAHNGPALIRQLREQRDRLPAADARRTPLEQLIGYLADNADSMWYRDRLRDGLPIGSGLIESACKTIISGRLKINSARWCVPRAERMAALRCLEYAGLTDAYWQPRAA